MSLVDALRRNFSIADSNPTEAAPPPPPPPSPPTTRDHFAAATNAECDASLVQYAKAHRPLPPNDGHLFTKSSSEITTTKTPTPPAEVITALREEWPGLSEEGARTIVAQYVAETKKGDRCWNYNLLNQKEPDPHRPHMYLKNVWESLSPEAAARAVAKHPDQVSVATPEECAKHGWNAARGEVVVVFQPPHPASRFKAFPNLEAGVASVIAVHQRISANYPDYLVTLNSGDTHAVAHTLKLAHYYTGPESSYARNMSRAKANLPTAVSNR